MINEQRTNVTRLNLTNTNFMSDPTYRFATAGARGSATVIESIKNVQLCNFEGATKRVTHIFQNDCTHVYLMS